MKGVAEIFLTTRLRQLYRAVEDGTGFLYRQNKSKAPPTVKYMAFLTSLFASHGMKGQGMQHPEAVSTQRKCLVQCSLPTIDLKGSLPYFPSSDFQGDHKVLVLLHHLKTSPIGRFNEGVSKHEFGKKALQQYFWC